MAASLFMVEKKLVQQQGSPRKSSRYHVDNDDDDDDDDDDDTDDTDDHIDDTKTWMFILMTLLTTLDIL